MEVRECCLGRGRPEDVLLDRLCKFSQRPPLPRGASEVQGWAPPCLAAFHSRAGSDSAGQGKGKITLHKMIIQFLCRRNKSPLLPHTSGAVSNRALCQRNGFYDGSGAFIMTAQGINTAQHQTA